MKKIILTISMLFAFNSFAKELQVCANGETVIKAKLSLLDDIGDYNRNIIDLTSSIYDFATIDEEKNGIVNMEKTPDAKIYKFGDKNFMACTTYDFKKIEFNAKPKEISCYKKTIRKSTMFKDSEEFLISSKGADYFYKVYTEEDFEALSNIIGCTEITNI